MRHVLWFILVLIFITAAVYLILKEKAEAPIESVDVPAAMETDEEGVSYPVIPEDVALHIAALGDLIVVAKPQPLTEVTSPLYIEGAARGMWFFEGSFPIVVVDWDGKIIGEGIATATEDWMTENFVPFTATIDFSVESDVYSKKGTIILRRDNPSGLPENDAALEIPINFK